ncbi:MAG: alpha/beta fold hydrolase [Gemmatimonadetes bacterium]|nr:alpha/beta fold hydrolase [Gemmatimonadota bacterium]
MKVAAAGVDLHVEVTGPAAAPILVLLHAFPLTGAMWSSQVEALAANWRIVVPDFRGFGQSGVGDGQYTIDFFVDDLFAVLDATTRRAGEPVVACGLSMGGYVLLRAVEREPARFRGLILSDTRSGADENEAKLKRVGAIRALKEKGAAAYGQGFAEGALGKTTQQSRPDVVKRIQTMVQKNQVAGMVGGQLAMAARTDTGAALSKISTPTLVVVGAEDTLTPPEASREMAGRIPGARLEVIPGAGHLPALEATEVFNRVLKDFLEPALLAL